MDRLSNGLLALGALLIVLALGLAAHNLCRDNAAARQDAQVVASLHQLVSRRAEADQAAAEEPIPQQDIPWSLDMPVVQVEGQDYIGLLSVPGLALELPVMAAWDYSALRVAPCRYAGSVYTDNMVIAAHNYAGHFGRLKELPMGERLSFTDADGNVFDYTVEEIELLEPYAVEQMTHGDWDLTLFTCTVDSRRRVTLRASRVF